jgi:hypothetical protein
MSKGLCFWIIMLLFLIGGLGGFFWGGWFSPMFGGMGLVVWILAALLGWQVFGAPIQ